MLLTLRQLNYFVAVVDAANMSGAARLLNVAPTALSLQVKAMEEALGVRLLDRHSRGVRPTESGSTLYERALAILALVEETERAIRPSRPFEGQVLRLGMPPAVARTIGVDAVLGAATRFGGLSMQVTEAWSADLMDKLRSGGLHFVIGYGVEAAEGIEAVQFLEERFLLVGTPERVGLGGPVTLDSALDSELIFYGDRAVAWATVAEAATQSGRDPPQKREVEAIDIWRSMLCRGVALAITPFGAVAEECQRGELAVREIHRPRLLRRLGLAGQSEMFATARKIGLVGFLANLTVEAHLALGAYYRTIGSIPNGATDGGPAAETEAV
jgi:LysR family nitrogen assimilation transcriptional regulator